MGHFLKLYLVVVGLQVAATNADLLQTSLFLARRAACVSPHKGSIVTSGFPDYNFMFLDLDMLKLLQDVFLRGTSG